MSDEKKDAPTISLSDVAQKTDLEFPMVVWAWERRGPYLTVNMRSADWPTFWQSLTPTEVAAALRAAPRVAGEWEQYSDRVWVRRSVQSNDIVLEAHEDGTWDVFVAEPVSVKCVKTLALNSAKQFADAALRKAGWVLL